MATNERRGLAERVLNGVILALSAAYFALILWQQADPSAEPVEALRRAMARAQAHLRWKRGLGDTLADIRNLPERKDNDA